MSFYSDVDEGSVALGERIQSMRGKDTESSLEAAAIYIPQS